MIHTTLYCSLALAIVSVSFRHRRLAPYVVLALVLALSPISAEIGRAALHLLSALM